MNVERVTVYDDSDTAIYKINAEELDVNIAVAYEGDDNDRVVIYLGGDDTDWSFHAAFATRDFTVRVQYVKVF